MAKHDTEAFHFPEHHDPAPDLTDEVDRLRNAGRHRSALDTILRFLRANGRSAEAFRWALPLLRTIRNPPDPDIAEPGTQQQLRNAYFAPIATECARCMKFWYSGHVLLSEYTGIVVSNPIGQQCQVCRYTLCRDCLNLRDARCPEQDCSGELGVPVFPTGRPRGMPANQHTEKLEHVLILWQGTPTSTEEITELLDLACTWQHFAGITVRSDEVERNDFNTETGQILVAWAEADGLISPGALERTRTARINSPGFGQRLFFITAAPTTGAASQLSGPIRYLVSRKQPRKRGWFRRDR